MEFSFDIKNKEGDHIRIALSDYDEDNVRIFTTHPDILNLKFYNITLVRIDKKGEFIGLNILNRVSDILYKFLEENSNAVLTFYCDPKSDIRRRHNTLSPQGYRSRLFTQMYHYYFRSLENDSYYNYVIEITNELKERHHKEYIHFIFRKEFRILIESIGSLIKEK